MRNLFAVFCVFAFVSPVLCFPQGPQSQPVAPIILITTPLEPGEIVVLGDQHAVEVAPEEVTKEDPAPPVKNVEDLVPVPSPSSEAEEADRKPQKPAHSKPQKPTNRPQRPGQKPQKPKPQRPKPQKPKPQKPKPQKPGSGRPQKPGGARPQRPSKPQKPGKPQQKPQKPGQRPNRPQRPPQRPDDDLKTETTTILYEYDDASTTEFYSEEVVPTTRVPDFAVPHK